MTKSRTSKVLGFLLTLSVATNGFLIFSLFDQSISYTYLRAAHQDYERALHQTTNIISSLINGKNDRKAISEAAKTDGLSASFEKEGYVWVSGIGLKFDEHDKLKAVHVQNLKGQ